MSESQLSVQTAPKASDQLATFLGIEKGMMLDTLKAQCFKGKRPEEVTDAQLASFVSTANVLQVNPLVPGMLYCYPEKNGGVVPILGPDGVMKKLDEFIASGKLTGYDCEVKMGADGRPESATASIYRKDGDKPARYTAWFSEWVVSNSPVWQQKPRHMLWLRAIKQCARQVIHGLPMDDEEYKIAQMHNVTPETEAPPVERAPMKPRSPKGAAAVKNNEKVVDAEVVDAPAAKPAEPVKQAEPVKEAPKTEPKSVTPEPVKEAPKAEPVKEAPKAAAKVESFADAAAATGAQPAANVEQRALLRADETIEVTASITAFKVITGTRDGKPHPYVTADIDSPELKGQVSQTDGGIGADGKPLPVWQLEQPVRVKVRGKKFSNGRLANVVDAIAMAEADNAEV